MGNRRYLNFDLLLEEEGDGQYSARVTASPMGGQQARVDFRLPFDATTLENLLLKLDPGRSGMLGPGDPVHEQAAMAFGGPLFETIFTGDLAFVWRTSLQQSLTDGASGLRLRLRLDDAPALAGLPWELLYDTRDRIFTAQSERTPVVRVPRVWDEPQPMRVDGPLHVLAVISSPLGLEELDVEREWRGIERALAKKADEGLVVVKRLPEATITGLSEWLRDNPTHVLHFVGHGNFRSTGDEGFIYFQDEHGNQNPVTAAVLGPFIRDHETLQMVVLNACRGARNSPRDPYGGMAQGLVLRGAKAVVAMQFPISDKAAARFSGDFYGALSAGLPVDQAVGYARKTLQATYGGEWATPVLFMRSPDGNIFENVKAPPDWVPPGPDPRGPLPPDPLPPDPLPPDPLPPDPLPPDPPVRPPTWSVIAGWVRAHSRVVGGAASVLVVVVAAVVAWRLLSGESPPPTVERFDDTELVVAAGDENFTGKLDLYRVDVDRNTSQRLSTDGESLLPVLSPDRGSMVYMRRGTPWELRIVAADGSGDRLLFGTDPPAQCGKGASRPAWIPGTDDLVLRCEGDDGSVTLVRVGIDGEDVQELLRLPLVQFDVGWVGDPTVSPDGQTVVFFGESSSDAGDREGALYRLDLTPSAEPELLAEETPGMWAFSDAMFSPTENRIAWRAKVPSQVKDADYDVFIATFDGGGLSGTTNISNAAPDADADETRDQDPSFSPDGSRLVYGSQTTRTEQGEVVTVQDLVVVPVDALGNQVVLEIDTDDLPRFRSVPSWTSVAAATE